MVNSETIRVAGGEVAIWPAGVKVELLAAPNTGLVEFPDRELYHAGLAAKILEMERDPRYQAWIFKGGCGTKVRDPHEWGSPEADLINARAMELAAKALEAPTAAADDSWANDYRKGNDCSTRSHLRHIASTLYRAHPADPVVSA